MPVQFPNIHLSRFPIYPARVGGRGGGRGGGGGVIISWEL